MTDPQETTYVDNTTAALARSWHAVACSDELGAEPLGIELLGERWVLGRVDGQLVAFGDRCPHRLAPLSIGTICGATLQCGYHGWKFDTSGKCVEIPALGVGATIPPRSALRTAAGVAERFGLIWLAPDEPVTGLPIAPEWDDPTFNCSMNVPRRTPVSAAQLVDNFLDATHLGTVHRGTFGVDDDGFLPANEVEREGWLARTTYEIQYRNYDDPLVDSGVHPLVQPQLLYKEVTGPTTAVIRLIFPLTGKTICFMFACLPENATSTRIFKLMARDDLAPGDSRLPGILEFEDRVLDEDLAVLESYPKMALATDLRTEVHTRADRLGVAYRRILGDLIAVASPH